MTIKIVPSITCSVSCSLRKIKVNLPKLDAPSIWGGSRRRIHGFLLGMVGAGVSKTIFGGSRP
ncbi:hypothetical protein NIES2101_26915 [Calothrix sp. HK-06]|nr:hypothetical protein NIES2101_26915 [Calothrix sp. HK-06]